MRRPPLTAVWSAHWPLVIAAAACSTGQRPAIDEATVRARPTCRDEGGECPHMLLGAAATCDLYKVAGYPRRLSVIDGLPRRCDACMKEPQ